MLTREKERMAKVISFYEDQINKSKDEGIVEISFQDVTENIGEAYSNEYIKDSDILKFFGDYIEDCPEQMIGKLAELILKAVKVYYANSDVRIGVLNTALKIAKELKNY